MVSHRIQYSDILSILGYSVVGTANSDAYDYTKYPSYLEDVLEVLTGDAEVFSNVMAVSVIPYIKLVEDYT